jgi:hypothetical protein
MSIADRVIDSACQVAGANVATGTSALSSNEFLDSALAESPRLLGALNRNSLSRQFGSFDRGYWHYRTHVISCARLQEGALTLAYLFLHNFEGNQFHRDPRLLDWIEAALSYAVKLQHSNGAFDEWYPNEKSLVATAFVTNALAETVLLFRREGMALACEDRVRRCIGNAAKWLAGRQERLVYNQSAGALCALSAAAEVVEDDKWLAIARQRAADLVSNQTDEGWWCEYGGPDIGYLSLHLDYLAKYFERARDELVRPAIVRALEFISHFIHPDCSAGGEYMSRNTEYLIPSGFVRLSRLGFADARLPAAAAHRALRTQSGVTPRSLDERYLCYILYNWLDAGLGWDGDETPSDALTHRSLDKFFPKAGLRVIADHRRYFVANLCKGGSFRLYVDGKLAVDSGVEVALTQPVVGGMGGATHSTNCDESSCETRYFFSPVREPVLGPFTGAMLNLLQIGIGKIPWLQRQLKSLLRNLAIRYGRNHGTQAIRRFELAPNGLRVIDIVPAPPSAINLGRKSSYTLVPSSKYFSRTDTTERFTPVVTVTEDGDKTIIRRDFCFGDGRK